MAEQRSLIQDAPPMLCERCGDPEIVGMWSPDGLPGHEILVCNGCWKWLTEDAEVRL